MGINTGTLPQRLARTSKDFAKHLLNAHAGRVNVDHCERCADYVFAIRGEVAIGNVRIEEGPPMREVAS